MWRCIKPYWLCQAKWAVKKVLLTGRKTNYHEQYHPTSQLLWLPPGPEPVSNDTTYSSKRTILIFSQIGFSMYIATVIEGVEHVSTNRNFIFACSIQKSFSWKINNYKNVLKLLDIYLSFSMKFPFFRHFLKTEIIIARQKGLFPGHYPAWDKSHKYDLR